MTVRTICVAAHTPGSVPLLLIDLRLSLLVIKMYFLVLVDAIFYSIDRVQLGVTDLRCGSLRRGESLAPPLETLKISKEVFSLPILCV